MRIAVIQFPGSNCERETMLAIQRAEMEPVPFLWNESHEKLKEADGYVIVGGFSYEDRSRAGIIAALDPVMREIKAQSEKGKPVLGICNGAQILVETGLVPGLENNKIGVALAENKRVLDGKVMGTGYYNTWVHMRLADQYQRNAFTRYLTPKDILNIPIAHGEGRFVFTPALWEEMAHQGLHVFQYCDEAGRVIDAFPINPNGSLHNIAALSNKAGNVLAMMPHPERTTAGDAIFQSMRDYIRDGKIEKTVPLHYYPRPQKLSTYEKAPDHYQLIIELMITDNQALTVQHTLQQCGISVQVKRQVYWELECETDATYQKIKQSGVLFNERKEMEADAHPDQEAYLVMAKEDLIGQQKCQMLQEHFHMTGLRSIKQGVIWHFKSSKGKLDKQVKKILQTHILANPYSQDYYRWE